MYNDMYDTFSDKTFEYSYPFSFQLQNQPYLEMIDKAEICWNFGDEVLLQIPLEVYLNTGDYLNLKIYNFRYEEIFSDTVDSSAYFRYYVDKDELRNLLIPGNYSMSVTLIDEENNIRETLLDSNVLKIMIK